MIYIKFPYPLEDTIMCVIHITAQRLLNVMWQFHS